MNEGENIIKNIKDAVLVKTLIKACYERNFIHKVQQLLNDAEDKNEISLKISSACGVQLPYCTDYASQLSRALLEYRPDNNSIIEFKDCTMDCMNEQGKTQCENCCEFDAIEVGEDKLSIYVNSERCIQCGFCIEVCANKHISYKADLIPMIYLLTNNR